MDLQSPPLPGTPSAHHLGLRQAHPHPSDRVGGAPPASPPPRPASPPRRGREPALVGSVLLSESRRNPPFLAMGRQATLLAASQRPFEGPLRHAYGPRAVVEPPRAEPGLRNLEPRPRPKMTDPLAGTATLSKWTSVAVGGS